MIIATISGCGLESLLAEVVGTRVCVLFSLEGSLWWSHAMTVMCSEVVVVIFDAGIC